MDAQQFGTFVAELRREHGMTQAELAACLRVTDKAVSRWERGLGFPDIGTLEPLAQALGIGIDELMRTERNRTPTDDGQAAQAVVNTVQVANDAAKKYRRTWRRAGLLLGAVVLLIVALWLAAGFAVREDVYLREYASPLSGQMLMIRVGIAGPMGYVRTCRNISDDPSRMVLRFYSTFGGLNSRAGARDVFVLETDYACQEICIERDGEYVPILRRDEGAVFWHRVLPS